MSRLPQQLREVGEVVIAHPAHSGAVAHRRHAITTDQRMPGTNWLRVVVTAHCRPSVAGEPPVRYLQVSAGYADATWHAVACPDCFPATDPGGPS